MALQCLGTFYAYASSYDWHSPCEEHSRAFGRNFRYIRSKGAIKFRSYFYFLATQIQSLIKDFTAPKLCKWMNERVFLSVIIFLYACLRILFREPYAHFEVGNWRAVILFAENKNGSARLTTFVRFQTEYKINEFYWFVNYRALFALDLHAQLTKFKE